MLTIRKTAAALFAAAATLATPALAGEDERYYEQNRSQYISHERAAQIAAEHVGGRAGEVDFEYSRLRGAYFEVEVHTSNGEHEVDIDAKTGRVLKVERDH